MDAFMNMLHNQVKNDRMNRFSQSNQLSLGELIAKLKAIPLKSGDDEQYVQFDFGNNRPVGVDSWRGSYDELAIEYKEEGEYGTPKLSEVIKMLEEALDKTYTGYKGGDYTMSKITPVWVANYGDSGNTQIVDVLDDGFRVILITAWGEF